VLQYTVEPPDVPYQNASKAGRPGPAHPYAGGQRHGEQTPRRQQPHLLGQEA